jgi:prolyl oligopeptidase
VREEREISSSGTGLQNQSVLYVIDAPCLAARELLDPNALSKDGTVALSGWCRRGTDAPRLRAGGGGSD